MSDFLRCENLHKSYLEGSGRSLEVLKGVTIDVEKGEFLSITGPSGAGKSTLLHLLGGLDEPTFGSVFIDGKDIFAINRNRRARLRLKKIGFVFQFYHLLPEFNIMENVMLPVFIARSLQARELRKKAQIILEEVGLKDRMTHRPAEISGGEAQRAAIARALINEPEIILCDEPTGNLDSETGEKIFELLMKLNKEKKRTFVIVSHDENIAKKAHRVVRLKDGQLKFNDQ